MYFVCIYTRGVGRIMITLARSLSRSPSPKPKSPYLNCLDSSTPASTPETLRMCSPSHHNPIGPFLLLLCWSSSTCGFHYWVAPQDAPLPVPTAATLVQPPYLGMHSPYYH